MMNERSSEAVCVLTVGHSNHTAEQFLGLLTQHQIEVLVDVRSSPSSRFSPHFGATELRASLSRSGLRYLFLGDECGGRPSERVFYDDEGYVLYDRVAASVRFREGIGRLEAGISRFCVALMCSEEDPIGCHRRLLVSRVLMARASAEVLHIRGDGRIETEREVAAREPAALPQTSLFGDEPAPAWRSVRPVVASPRR